MALFLRSGKNFSPTKCIRIIDSQMTDDHTVYKIEVNLGECKWTVVKRYSEFYDLHEKIMKEFPMIDKEMLPKKKLFGNHSKSFIAKRREALQVYLQSLLRSLTHPPAILMTFLSFHKYEVHGLTEGLAEELYRRGEALLASNRFSTLSTLQMFAIGTRLMLTEPTCISKDVKKDIGHLVDFVSRLQHLQLIGQPVDYASSNIVPNDLHFNFQHFKSLQTLKLVSCRLPNITIDDHVKKNLKKLVVSRSLSHIKHVLMRGLAWEDCSHLTQPMIDEHSWLSLETAILRSNKITHIDDSVKLIPNVKKLILSDNRLDDIDNLIHLSFLYFLDLSINHFSSVHLFHTKLGNVSHLNLSKNNISCLEGFSKLYSLVDLNLSHNCISALSEVPHLGTLPFLTVLDLRNNPLHSSVDYRLSVLAQFTERFAELTLDGVKTHSKEVELVLVRQVILRRKSLKPSNNPSNTSNNPSNTSNNPSNTSNNPSNNTSNNQPSNITTYNNNDNNTNNNDNTNSLNKPDFLDTKQTDAKARAEEGGFKDAHKKSKKSKEFLGQEDTQHSEKVSRAETTASKSQLLLNAASVEQFVSYKAGHQDISSKKRKPAVKSRRKYFILPETLPNHTDKSLLSTMQSLLASVVLKGGLKDFDLKQETPCCVAWCGVVLSHSRFQQADGDLPCCVCVTAHSFHLLRVDALRGDAGTPKMKHLTSFRFSDVLCFLLGARKTYVRIILRDQPSSFLVFITFSASKTEHLLSQIKKAYRRSVPELDEYEDPLVFNVGAGCEQHLLACILPFESDPKLITIDQQLQGNLTHLKVTFFQLVQPIREDVEPQQGSTHALVATTHNIYIIKQDFTYSPPISAHITPIDVINCQSNSNEVVSVFPIAGRIVTIQFYDVDSLDHQLTTYLNHRSPGLMNNNDFIGYGLRITFQLGLHGVQTLDLRWPTSNLRDTFLTWFVETRNDIRESSSSSSVPATSKQSRKKQPSASRHLSDDEYNYPSQNKDFRSSNLHPSTSHQSPHYATPHKSPPVSHSSSDSESCPVPLLGTRHTNTQHPSSNTFEIEASCNLRLSSPCSMHDPDNDLVDDPDNDPDNDPVDDPDNDPDNDPVDDPGDDPDNDPGDDPSDDPDNDPEHEFSLGLDGNLKNSSRGSYEDFEQDMLAEFDCIPVNSISPGEQMLEEEQYRQVENLKIDLRTRPKTIEVSDISNLTQDSSEIFPDLKYKHISEDFLSSLNDSPEIYVPFPSLRDLSSDLDKLDLFMGRHVITRAGETLQHLTIASIGFHDHPQVLIPACVLLTNYSIHFFSNFDPTLTDYNHVYSRTRPYSVCVVNTSNEDISMSLNNFNKPLLRRMAVVDLQTLYEVDLGMFGQSIRFVVHDEPYRIVSCLTRDGMATQALVQQLLKCLSTEHPPKMLNPTQPQEVDGDECYNMFGNSKNQECPEEFVFNFVRFFYPSHELITDLSFIVSFSAQLDDPQLSKAHDFKKLKFLAYLSCFVFESTKEDAMKDDTINSAYLPLRPECLVLTREKVTFVIEDCVSFPLPDFFTFPPDCRQFEFKRTYNVSDLRQLVRYGEDVHLLKMVFSNSVEDEEEEEEEEDDEINVDISYNHFDGEDRQPAKKRKNGISVVIHVSNSQDVDSLLQKMSEHNQSISFSTLPLFDF